MDSSPNKLHRHSQPTTQPQHMSTLKVQIKMGWNLLVWLVEYWLWSFLSCGIGFFMVRSVVALKGDVDATTRSGVKHTTRSKPKTLPLADEKLAKLDTQTKELQSKITAYSWTKHLPMSVRTIRIVNMHLRRDLQGFQQHKAGQRDRTVCRCPRI